jgi:vanillate O-demethylase ferredoxin subunit
LETTITATVTQARIVADGVRLLTLAALGGEPLPGYAPGAHIDVFLPDGSARQYSLIDPATTAGTYRIAIAREDSGRGGSKYLHDGVAVGDALAIGVPRCHFGLEAAAPASVLFAGGIGVTPILCMAQALEAQGSSWRMHFGARTRGHATLIDEIEALAGARLHTYFNLEGDAPMDLPALVKSAPAGAHFYCCGPAPMIDAFRAACEGIASDRVHFEQFTAAAPAALDGGYDVELAKTRRTVRVETGESILDALSRAGLRMSYSCREGVCGSCETTVIAGSPDHRDAILTDAERAESKTMMICCSGSLGERLVLDL